MDKKQDQIVVERSLSFNIDPEIIKKEFLSMTVGNTEGELRSDKLINEFLFI